MSDEVTVSWSLELSKALRETFLMKTVIWLVCSSLLCILKLMEVTVPPAGMAISSAV